MKHVSYKKIMLISVIILITDFLHSQEKNIFDSTLLAFEKNELKKVNDELAQIDTTQLSQYNKATWLYYYADLNYRLDNHDKAYKNLILSSKIFEGLSKDKDVIDCYHLILSVLSHQNKINVNVDYFLEKIESYALKTNDSVVLRRMYHSIASNFIKNNNQSKAITYFKKIIPIVAKLKDCVRIGYCYENIGTAFQTTSPINIDSARFYTQKALPFYKIYKKDNAIAYNFNNQAEQFKLLKQYKKAIEYYKKADSIPLTKHKEKSKLIFYENISNAYHEINDFANENIYLRKYNKLKDSINDTQQNIAISKIKEEYDNEKLRADNLEIESKRKQNLVYFIVSLISLILGSIAFLLFLKNSRKKRLLAEQQQELEKQKNLTLLKEQEINTINAMVEGQEKERVRIAEDLHDNIGSVLATLKLHFENLKLNRDKKHFNQEELYNKTEKLIDETYLKVRSIAHAKNAGVIANQGLLVAIKIMAEKISAANKIKIEVVDFGLDQRLENNTEITIFRIIQELTTNIIKHAEASEATINISQYDDELNIIIEDNGKGFDLQKTSPKKGMGIDSVEKRIQHLNGTFQIDSTPKKGTSVIINIPIE